MAILSGDALLVYAFEHVARDTKGVAAERIVRVIVELGRASGADGLVGGQVVDIQSEDKEVRAAGAAGQGAVAVFAVAGGRWWLLARRRGGACKRAAPHTWHLAASQSANNHPRHPPPPHTHT
jgi:hypothetical protein